jgi:hypothetical protein
VNRREAIFQGAAFAAAATLGLTLPVRTWAALPLPAGVTDAEAALLDTIGETILPTTPDSPGAGAVGIGRFIFMMAADCQPADAVAALRRGLAEIDAASRGNSGGAFAGLPAPAREAVLLAYEKRAAAETARGSTNPFRLIKELTLFGYFTSEAGATQALRYEPVPGGYRGSVPLRPGDRSWAT